MTKISINSVLRDMTVEEQAEYDARQIENDNSKLNRKLLLIKNIRLQKLKETDWMGISDNTMSSDWITKRQSWRDIPQNFTTESQYDLLLARDSNGKLTHSIWSKP